MTRTVGQQVARGAVWMIAVRFLDRGIGFVSTLILARLLVPEDFGLIAMAMAVFAFVEMGGQFGFDLALIREREASRAHYDSAWTLQVAYGAFMAAALAALTWPVSHFYDEPRIVNVLLVMGAISFLQGFENIGIVNFRKEFQFSKDFRLMLAKKLAAFVVTLTLALTLRSYWALLGGFAASRLTGVALSYWMHAYRPRFDLSEARGLLTFSRWIVLRSFVDYLIERGPDLIIGRLLNAGSLGLYRVSREIATLPTSELIMPMMRAVFPGYAALAQDRQRLADSFVLVQSIIVFLALPAGVGIVLLAAPIVDLLLGPKWAGTVVLVQVLGLYGAITVFQATNMSIFNVLGLPGWGAAVKGLEAALLLPAVYLACSRSSQPLEAAAWSIVGAQLVVIPVGMALISRLLKIGFQRRLSVAWRPVLGTALMAVGLELTLQLLPSQRDAFWAAVRLAVAIPVGAAIYLGSTALLWRLAGQPVGAESRFLDALRSRFVGGPATT